MKIITNRQITCLDIEIAVMKYFGVRTHLIVPNVYWGLGFRYEIDLLVLTKAGCATEVEIKTSRQDLKADLKKKHQHDSVRIKKLYFAIPDYMKKDIDLIPDGAGILTIDEEKFCKEIRKPEIRSKYKFTDRERLKLATLGCMRLLGLNEAIMKTITNQTK